VTTGQYGALGLGLSTWAITWYVRAKVRRDVGSRAAWTVWAATEVAILITQYARGARASLLVQLPQVAGALVICVIAWRRGTREVSRRDVALFTATALALALWVITRDATLAIVLGVAVEYGGLVPTVTGAWHRPDSEPLGSWLLVSAAGLTGLRAVRQGSAAVLFLYPASLTAMAAIVALAAVAGAWRDASPATRKLVGTGLAAVCGLGLIALAVGATWRPTGAPATPARVVTPSAHDPAPAEVIPPTLRPCRHRQVTAAALPAQSPQPTPSRHHRHHRPGATRKPTPASTTPGPTPSPTPTPTPSTPSPTPSPTASTPSPTPTSTSTEVDLTGT
jgi:hypothetical protein